MKKILVVSLDNFGDTVMATPVIGALRAAAPAASISFWVKAYAAEILSGQSIDTIHASDPFWDKAPGRGKGSPADFFRTFAAVRRAKYDTAIILSTEWRRSLACRIAGIPRRIGLDQRKSGPFLTEAVAPRAELHVIGEHRLLVERALGTAVSPGAFFPSIVLSADERKESAAWRDRMGWRDNPLVIFHPFAGAERRRWPAAHWRELIDRYERRRAPTRFVVLCAAKEAEAGRAMLVGLRPESAVMLAGESLSRVKSILGTASVFVGGDSGPGHLAAAIGVPLVSIFGPSNENRFGPRGRGPIKILKAASLPDLSVESVDAELSRFLSTREAVQ